MNKPNFLVIMTDQHCFDQLSCHGNPIVKTPNIDALCNNGTSINGMHTATPMCMPNRQAFLTMQMNSANGSHSNGVSLDLDCNTFPELLRAAGYRTALIGKSHLQNMAQLEPFMLADEVPVHRQAPPAHLANADKSAQKYREPAYKQEFPTSWHSSTFEPQTPYYGFDDVVFTSSHAEIAGFHHKRYLDQVNPSMAENIGRKNALEVTDLNQQTYASSLPPEHYPTQFVADQSNSWLTQQAKERPGQPFFLWTSFPDPHHPWTPPKKYYDMYDPADVVLPDSFYESTRNQNQGVCVAKEMQNQGIRQPRMPFMADEAEARKIIATAYGMITFIDEMVGEIVETLKQNNQLENTVLIFTSDHGDYMGHHGLFLKGPLHYQALIKTPFIWCDPNQSFRHGPINALASIIDIGRTILDRAGLSPFHGCQGRSLLPLLAGKTDTIRKRVLVETIAFSPQFSFPIWAKIRTLVTDKYRLTVYTHTDEGEFYDLENDPLEMQNLWGSPEHTKPKSDLMLQTIQEMAELTSLRRLPFTLA